MTKVFFQHELFSCNPSWAQLPNFCLTVSFRGRSLKVSCNCWGQKYTITPHEGTFFQSERNFRPQRCQLISFTKINITCPLFRELTLQFTFQFSSANPKGICSGWDDRIGFLFGATDDHFPKSLAPLFLYPVASPPPRELCSEINRKTWWVTQDISSSNIYILLSITEFHPDFLNFRISLVSTFSWSQTFKHLQNNTCSLDKFKTIQSSLPHSTSQNATLPAHLQPPSLFS